MNYNDLRRKYGTSQPEPEPQVAPETQPETQREPETHVTPRNTRSVSRPKPLPDPQPVDLQSNGQSPNPGQRFGQTPGFFGSDTPMTGGNNRRERTRRRRNRSGRGFSMNWLAALPWVDIIMITLTVIGVIWVIANFDAVTTILAAGIAKLAQSLLSVVIVVLLIVGCVMLFSRRRRWF